MKLSCRNVSQISPGGVFNHAFADTSVLLVDMFENWNTDMYNECERPKEAVQAGDERFHRSWSRPESCVTNDSTGADFSCTGSVGNASGRNVS